jgi:hypothetical protein
MIALEEVLDGAVRSAVRFIHDKGHKTILTAGRSADFAVRPFEAMWRAEYPTEPLPQIYNLASNNEENDALYKVGGGTNEDDRDSALLELLSTKIPRLENLKEKPVCFLEELMCSGVKAASLSRNLERVGITLDFAFYLGAPGERKVEFEDSDSVIIGVDNDELTKALYVAQLEFRNEELPAFLGSVDPFLKKGVYQYFTDYMNS